MTEWTARPVYHRDFTHSVPFSRDNMLSIKVYEASVGNTTEKNRFSDTNAATKIVGQIQSVALGIRTNQDAVMEKKTQNMSWQ